jgi:hypothetical protein
MATALIVLSVVLVVVIALIVVGREARRLDTVAPRTAYILDAAVQYVADSIAPASQARLSHADVRALVLLHLERFEGRGLAPEDVTDRRAAALRRRDRRDRLSTRGRVGLGVGR